MKTGLVPLVALLAACTSPTNGPPDASSADAGAQVDAGAQADAGARGESNSAQGINISPAVDYDPGQPFADAMRRARVSLAR